MDGGQQPERREGEEKESFNGSDATWGSGLFDNMCENDSGLPYLYHPLPVIKMSEAFLHESAGHGSIKVGIATVFPISLEISDRESGSRLANHRRPAGT